MNIIYLIGIVVIVKLFYSLYKSDSVNKKQIHNGKIANDRSRFVGVPEKCNTGRSLPKEHNLTERIYSEEEKTDLKTSIERPEMSKKNKWLYPPDQFGKMGKGVVD